MFGAKRRVYVATTLKGTATANEKRTLRNVCACMCLRNVIIERRRRVYYLGGAVQIERRAFGAKNERGAAGLYGFVINGLDGT